MSLDRYHIKKFFAELESHGGFLEDRAVLFVYNEEAPELSKILIEVI